MTWVTAVQREDEEGDSRFALERGAVGMVSIWRVVAAGALLLAGTPAAAQQVTIGATATPQEQSELQGWIDAAAALIQSEAFRTNLASLHSPTYRVYFRGALPQLVLGTANDLVSMMTGAGGFRFVPAPLALSGNNNAYGGSTGPIVFDPPSAAGSMTLFRGDLGRWRSANLVERSCAINTIVHEISHTVAIHATRFEHALEDYHRRQAAAGTPAGSYLIGTVAQCTWLQQQGRIGATPAALKDCLAVFGTRHFNSLRCDRFDAAQPVVVRNGLPGEATD